MLTSSLDAAVAQRSAATPPAPRETAVAVRGLRCAYGDTEVVHGIDLDVHRGEIVAVLGPNGAGKTTTVEVLEGFRPAAGGSVTVLGEDPAHAGARWRDRIGVVLQDSEPELGLTARECLKLYAGYYADPRPVDATLRLVGLAEQADTTAGRLSGGQRRRLDVALALIGNPELLFLDEPTTGFDPSARRAAWDLVASLRDLGTTILLTTHYMEEAERLADRIVVVAAGRVVAEGTPRTLGGRDRAAATISYVLPDGERVTRTSEHVARDLHELSGRALRDGVELRELEVKRPTLEDVYLTLTDTEDHR